jgi:hypothetical protein
MFDCFALQRFRIQQQREERCNNAVHGADVTEQHCIQFNLSLRSIAASLVHSSVQVPQYDE